MLISYYFILKNSYILPNFNYGMLCYVTISTSSRYVSTIGFTENYKYDDDYDDDDDDDDDTERQTDQWVQKIIYSLRCDDLLTHAPLVEVYLVHLTEKSN